MKSFITRGNVFNIVYDDIQHIYKNDVCNSMIIVVVVYVFYY